MSIGTQEQLIYSMPNEDSWSQAALNPVSSDMDIFIQPFDGGLVGYQARIKEINSLKVALNLANSIPIRTASQSEYEALVNKAIAFCKNHNGKVVCSRVVDIRLHIESEHITQWLEQLRRAFPATFVYLLNSKEFGIWMGATPETLVSKHGYRFDTMAFAATRWDDQPFDEKEIREQQIVTGTILHDLHLNSDAAGEPREVKFGAIRHLQTDIQWSSSESLLSAAAKLHPTPAVCGWPKAAAKTFITDNENYPRELYTGFLGIQNGATNVAFVNLRCVQLFRDRIRFYVGGGVNAMSNPTIEWEETQRKLRTLLDAMQINA